MSNKTGKYIEGVEHLRQSIADILTTRIGSRVISREYGSRIFEYIDKPLDAVTRIQIQTAALEALSRWEPRIVVDSFKVVSASAKGQIEFALTARIRATGEPFTHSDTLFAR